MLNLLKFRHCQSMFKGNSRSIRLIQNRSTANMSTTTSSDVNPICMNKTNESSSKTATNQSVDGTSRSNRSPMGSILIASRLISYLSKQPRPLASRRNYTVSFNNNNTVSLSNHGSSVRRRSSSTTNTHSSHSNASTPSDYNDQSKTITTSVTPSTPTPDTVGLNFNFDSTYEELRELTERNRQYFAEQNADVCRKFEHVLTELLNSIDLSMPFIRYLTDNFHHFDYSPEVRANGYRTLVVAHGQACLRTLDILHQIDVKREGFLFNLMHASRLFPEIQSWTKALVAMQQIIGLAVKMVDYSQKKILYVDASEVPLDVELDYFKMVAFDTEHFFGRTCGFQFAPSMQTMLTFLLAGLATFHETYNKSIPYAAASLASAPKYLLFPEQRAKKCADIFRDSDYLFCKSFWNIVDHDYIKMGARYIVPNVTVAKYFQIGPEPIEINSIVIPPPTARAGPEEPSERAAGNIGAGAENATGSGSKNPQQLVNIKLLSNEIREGMSELPLTRADLEIASNEVLPMSDQLLMHIHGGGFIATSSSTHEVYLKPWALGLEIPIVSVDYSLAPEYPFPRAIEECFYAYAWILKNAKKLGWTGKTLLLAGDSAGGNLLTIVTIKAIEMGLRKPDAIICFYTPFLLGYSMSPSRLMAIMDPLLNTGFLWRCLSAYAGIKADDEPPHDDLESATTDNLNKVSTTPLHEKVVPDLEKIKEDLEKLGTTRDDRYYSRLGKIMGSQQAYLLRKLRESTLPDNPYMSPLRASDDTLRQFPTTYLIPCARDPFIDDNVEFARRLRDLNVPHHLTVVDEWPHGFLDFGFAAIGVAQYNIEIINMLQKIVKQSATDTKTAASVPDHID